MATDNNVQQDFPMPNELPDFSVDLNENNMGTNMDLGISFDDLFGNNAPYRPGNNGASNDDWTQWMNAGA